MKKNKNLLDYLYCLSNGIKDDILDFINDFKKYLNRKINKNNNSSMPKKKVRLKHGAMKEIFVILLIAIIGAIFITIKSNLNDFININSNKVKEIKIINFLQADPAKLMTIDEREGIEEIASNLNSIKKEKIKDEKYDDVFTSNIDNDNKDDSLDMIIIVEYKKKSDIINVYENKIVRNKKEIETENNLDSLWYKLNYKISDINKTDFEKYILNNK